MRCAEPAKSAQPKQKEKSYGRDPRVQLPGEAVADWEAPAAGSLGRISSTPELEAALAVAQKSSKLVVLKYFAPWCSSCKSIEAKFARTAKANTETADFYVVGAEALAPGPHRSLPWSAARRR